MTEVARDHWRFEDDGDLSVDCPQCGERGSVSGYAVSAQGYVAPSVLHDPPDGCGFGDRVRLLEWTGQEIPCPW